MDTVKVFVNESGKFGNPVGIVVDENGSISFRERQDRAVNSGLSEIVFINDVSKNNISIFSPTEEIPFAGHAVIGAIYYLEKLKSSQICNISSMGTDIKVCHENNKIWVRAKLSKMPKWNFTQLSSRKEVEDINVDSTPDFKHCFVWSWIDKEKGILRARTFASDWLIPEDEANGSGSLILGMSLNKEIKILHGKGSIIYARPTDSIFGEVGGIATL